MQAGRSGLAVNSFLWGGDVDKTRSSCKWCLIFGLQCESPRDARLGVIYWALSPGCTNSSPETKLQCHRNSRLTREFKFRGTTIGSKCEPALLHFEYSLLLVSVYLFCGFFFLMGDGSQMNFAGWYLGRWIEVRNDICSLRFKYGPKVRQVGQKERWSFVVITALLFGDSSDNVFIHSFRDKVIHNASFSSWIKKTRHSASASSSHTFDHHLRRIMSYYST